MDFSKETFITFEGTEGCGKSTQIKLLAETLKSRGHDVVLTREPGGCPIADKIRAILLDSESRDMSPATELLLFAAARAQHFADVIRPALARGAIVLCDRGADSTFAFQVVGRGLPFAMFEAANNIATDGLKPSITFLLDISLKVGLSRANKRNGSDQSEARFDTEELTFHEKVKAGFNQLAEQEPERFRVIDANQEISAIAEDILAVLGRGLNKSRPA